MTFSNCSRAVELFEAIVSVVSVIIVVVVVVGAAVLQLLRAA